MILKKKNDIEDKGIYFILKGNVEYYISKSDSEQKIKETPLKILKVLLLKSIYDKSFF